MKQSQRVWMAWLVGLLAGMTSLMAQRDPRIGYVFPAGGRAPSRFEAVVGGQFLEGVTNVLVSGRGVKAEVKSYLRPLTAKELNDARARLEELRKERAAARNLGGADSAAGVGTNRAPVRSVVEIDGELAALRVKLQQGKRPANPQIGERTTLEITVSADAEPGDRELRLRAAGGVSNPLVFRVGELEERTETEPNDKSADSLPAGALPVVINGRVLPGDVDRFKFEGRGGEELVARVSARELVPYLADAVPGWFQARVAMYDSAGNELALAEGAGSRPDPTLHFACPKDGTYILEIRDALYRGREDFVYRVELGDLPSVTAHFPLGGRAGQAQRIAFTGWNLPQTEAMVSLPAGSGLCTLERDQEQRKLPGGRLEFAVDTLPECEEQGENDRAAEAQAVQLPIIVNGRIDPPGDRDVFRIEGRRGQVLVAEVLARRLGSPLDSVLRLTDASGRELAQNDDHADPGAGLETHHADSWLSATLAADGPVYLQISDTQGKGGPGHAYRLRISPPRPDFELRMVPSALNLRFGTTVPVTVYAVRRDGFAGDIALALKSAPAGFELGGARLPAGQDKIRFTLTAPAGLGPDPVRLQLEGRAMIEGHELRRPLVPADDVMQAFIYRHLVPARESILVLPRGARPGAAFRRLSEGVVRWPAGGSVVVPMAGPRRPGLNQWEFALSEPPDGVSIGDVTEAKGGLAIELKADASTTKPGLRGNLIVTAQSVRSREGKGAGEAPRRGGAAVVTLPAIPFEILETKK